MNFEFSEDQKMIQEQARHFLSEQSPVSCVRNIMGGKYSYDKKLWQSIAELGWMGTAIPEQYGGLGMGQLELCVIAEELGQALTPIPFFSNVYLAADLILRNGTEAQKQQHLPTIAAGEQIYCLANSEASSSNPLTPQSCKFEDGKISGEKVAVMDGLAADWGIVTALDSDAQTVLALVKLDQPGVIRNSTSSIDQSKPLATLNFDNANGELLAEGSAEQALLSTLRSAAVLCSFEQIGGSSAAMKMGMDYCNQRFAFGRSISSFQAIKHKFADMYVAIELARSNAYYGAWALHSDDTQLALAAATSRVSATEAFHFCSKENIEAHGGMGFTWEFDCHLYYKRAQLLSSIIGTSRWWNNELVDNLLEVA